MPRDQALAIARGVREAEFAAKAEQLLLILERFAQAKAAQDFYASMQEWELEDVEIAEKAAQAQIDQTQAERDAMALLASTLNPGWPGAYSLMA